MNRRAIVTTLVLAILAATLLPSRTDLRRPFSYCLACDFRWLADSLFNVALFVPLGVAAGWRAKSPWKVVVAGALLSTAIELLQILVPGRDPELRDILSNAAGTALGAALVYRPRTWLFPSDRWGAWLAGTSSVAILLVIASTAILLAPADAHPLLDVAHAGDDAVVRFQSRADAVGLDQPAYYVRGMLAGAPAGRVPVDVSRRSAGFCLRFAAVERCGIGPTAGRGWSVLVYPAAIAHRWADGLVDVAWTAALFLPLGFWTSRRRLALSIAVSIGLLGVVPVLVGLVPTTLGEWVGATTGIAVGVAIAEGLRRRYVPRIRTVNGTELGWAAQP